MFETTPDGIQTACGDCLEAMKSIPDTSIDMVLADLPYGTTRAGWDTKIDLMLLWNEYRRIAKKNAAVVLFASGMFTAELMMSNPKEWRYNLVWEKNTPTGHLNAKKMPLRSHEDICIFYRSQPVYNPQMTTGHERKQIPNRNTFDNGIYGGQMSTPYDSTERYPKSILKFPAVRNQLKTHPTEKPTGLLRYLIKTYSNEGDTILDNTMGSGSTGIACIEEGRRFVGIEIDEGYYSIAKERLRTGCAQGKLPL